MSFKMSTAAAALYRTKPNCCLNGKKGQQVEGKLSNGINTTRQLFTALSQMPNYCSRTNELFPQIKVHYLRTLGQCFANMRAEFGLHVGSNKLNNSMHENLHSKLRWCVVLDDSSDGMTSWITHSKNSPQRRRQSFYNYMSTATIWIRSRSLHR